MGERNTDPEAWLADQLAQVQMANTGEDHVCFVVDPGSQEFTAIEKLAHEYGEMCAARALDGVTVTGIEVEVKYSDEMPALPAIARLEADKIVVRPR